MSGKVIVGFVHSHPDHIKEIIEAHSDQKEKNSAYPLAPFTAWSDKNDSVVYGKFYTNRTGVFHGAVVDLLQETKLNIKPWQGETNFCYKTHWARV